MADFDPYFKWLGIPPEEQPPNHYRLLGIPLFSSDPEVIQNAVDQRMAHLRTMQVGPRAALAEQLLNQIMVAQVRLLDPARKAEYDRELRASENSAATPLAPPVVEQFRPTSTRPSQTSRRRPPAFGTLLKVVLGGIAGLIVGAAILRFGFGIDPFRAPPAKTVANKPDLRSEQRRVASTGPGRVNANSEPAKRAYQGDLVTHYFAPEARSAIRYLDWRESSWEHDIRDQFQVTHVADGYRVQIDAAGYESKLILFPEENVETKKLCIAFTVEYGNVRLSLRPKDLAPKGIPVFDGWYEPQKKFVVQLWVENGTAKATVNSTPITLHQLPDCFGYFAIDISRRSSIVIHELYFTDLASGAGH